MFQCSGEAGDLRELSKILLLEAGGNAQVTEKTKSESRYWQELVIDSER
jgi:hypothetical protein